MPKFPKMLVCALFLLAQIPAVTFGQSRIFQTYVKPMPMPDFSLEDLRGNTLNIQAYRGKVILLNFWATW